MTEPTYIEASASFDDDRIYRYSLLRRWAPGPTVLWIMLNPSTADESRLDPTLRRCLGFTRAWKPDPKPPRHGHESGRRYAIGWIAFPEFGAFEVCNLYALRSTDPKGLWRVPDPVGPGNDAAIQSAAKRASIVIVGWGTNAKPDRERAVAQLLADVGVQPHALHLAKGGHPGHPLYLPESLIPFRWHARGLR